MRARYSCWNKGSLIFFRGNANGLFEGMESGRRIASSCARRLVNSRKACTTELGYPREEGGQ